MEIFKLVSKRVVGAAGALTLVLALLAATAAAITPAQTREGYVEQVEPICKTNTQANERILEGARGKIKNGQLKAAAGQFSKATKAFEGAVTELRGVQQPSEDSAQLTGWFRKLDKQTKLLGEMAKALQQEKRSRVVFLQTQLIQNAEAANGTVLDFHFRYCKINSSKFT